MHRVHARSLLVALALLCAAAGCKQTPTSPAERATASTEGVKQALTFAWPVPCQATVTQKTDKDGTVTTMRYLLVATAAEGQRGKIAVNLEAFELLTVNGQDATTPKMKQHLAPALATASAMPTLLVGRDGRLADIVGLDAVRDKALALLKQSKGYKDDDPAWAAAKAAMSSPRLAAQMKKKSADHWKAWVGLWAGLALAEGQELSRTTALTMPDGTKLDAPLVYRHAGAVPGQGRLVRLTAQTVIEGAKARASMARTLAKLGRRAGKAPFKPSMIKQLKRVSSLSVDTDPSTLVPRRATMGTVSTTSIEGEAPKVRRETHEYSFDWHTRR